MTVPFTQQQITYSPDDVQFARFILAYFAAWKANAEFALNGLTPKYGGDEKLLNHVIGLWNNSHKPGATRTLTPRNNDIQSYQDDIISYPQACGGTFVPGGTQNEWWYASMLLNKLGVASLTVNTGPKIVVPNTLPATGGGGGIVLPNPQQGPIYTPPGTGGKAPASSSSGVGTGLLVVGGLAALGAGGVYLYGRNHGMTFGQTIRSGWDHIRHPRGGHPRHGAGRKTRR